LIHPNPDDGSVLIPYTSTLVIHKLSKTSPIVSAANLADAKDPTYANGLLDATKLLDALVNLEHFEIIVDVTGVENVTTAQVQARWSFTLEEIELAEGGKTVWETPIVHLTKCTNCLGDTNWLAQVHQKAVANFGNFNCSDQHNLSPGQLARAVAFHLPV
jgi:hypothetical protein